MTLKESDKSVLISHRINQSLEALDDIQFLLNNIKLLYDKTKDFYKMRKEHLLV